MQNHLIIFYYFSVKILSLNLTKRLDGDADDHMTIAMSVAWNKKFLPHSKLFPWRESWAWNPHEIPANVCFAMRDLFLWDLQQFSVF